MPTKTHLAEAIERLTVVVERADAHRAELAADPSVLLTEQRRRDLRLILAAASVFGGWAEKNVEYMIDKALEARETEQERA